MRLRAIAKHPLRLFAARVVGVLILSSLFWALVVVWYHERELARGVEAEIYKESGRLSAALSRQNVGAEFSAELGEYAAKSKTVEFIEILDANGQSVASYKQNALPPPLASIVYGARDYAKERSDILPLFNDKAYLYFQTKISANGATYYVRLLTRLDDATLLALKQGVYSAAAIVFLTVLFVSISVFPILYAQYNKVLSQKNMLLRSNLDTLKSLGTAIAKRDSETGNHNYRVAYYSVKLAEEMGYTGDFVRALIKGAFLHDVGKIAISDSILLKPSRLSEEEFCVMKTHVAHGVDIVDDIEWICEAKSVIAYHHEKVDGSGYPNGAKKEEIPMQARIFAVADVFDALTSKRPYKEPLDVTESLEIIMKGSGSHFDESVVSAFAKICKKLHEEVGAHRETSPKELFDESLRRYFN